jgi:hypothetical protein
MTERVYDIGDVIEDFELESQFGSISYRDLVHGKYSIIVTFGNALEPCATTDIGKNIIVTRPLLLANHHFSTKSTFYQSLSFITYYS